MSSENRNPFGSDEKIKKKTLTERRKTMENVKIIQLKNDETLHFSMKEYKGNKYFDIRVFFRSKNDGNEYPSKKGMTLNVAYLDSFLEGIEALKTESKKPSDELVKS